MTSMLSTTWLDFPWQRRPLVRPEADVRDKDVHDAPLPTVIDVAGIESAPIPSHREKKTFSELQKILIRSELGTAGSREARWREDRGE